MSDPDPIRAALVEAMFADYCARYEAEEGYPFSAVLDPVATEQFKKLFWHALSVVESWQPRKPCPNPECVQGRVQPLHWHEYDDLDIRTWDVCPSCDGEGTVASDVPGIIELLMEQAGKINEWDNGERRFLFPGEWSIATYGPKSTTRVYRLRERKP